MQCKWCQSFVHSESSEGCPAQGLTGCCWALFGLVQPPILGSSCIVLLKSSLGSSSLASLLICNILHLSCSRASVLLIFLLLETLAPGCLWGLPSCPIQVSVAGSLHYTGVRISTPVLWGDVLCAHPAWFSFLMYITAETPFCLFMRVRTLFYPCLCPSAFWESSKSLLPSRTFLVLDTSLYHSHFTIAGDLRS